MTATRRSAAPEAPGRVGLLGQPAEDSFQQVVTATFVVRTELGAGSEARKAEVEKLDQ